MRKKGVMKRKKNQEMKNLQKEGGTNTEKTRKQNGGRAQGKENGKEEKKAAEHK